MVGTGLDKVLGITPESVNLMIDLIPAPVFILDEHAALLDYNQSFQDFFDVSADCHGKALVEVVPESLADLLSSANTEEMTTLELEYRNRHNQCVALRIQLCPFLDRNGGSGGKLGLVFDITEDAKRYNRLRQLSIIDELTALPNRRHGLERVQNLVQQSQRNEFTFSFLILDIDSFKGVNDYEGHQAGDIVLRDIADIIQELCRSYDLAFRYGGDEFIICLPNTSAEAAAIFAERIRDAVAQHRFNLQDGSQTRTSISIGIANFPGDGDTLEELMSAADRALYMAKQKGKNRVVCARDIPTDKNSKN